MLALEMYAYLIGMTVKGANTIGSGVFVVRAISGPEGPYTVLRDYRTDRLNVAVDADNKITQILSVG